MKPIIDYHNRMIEEKGVDCATGFSEVGQCKRFEVIFSQIQCPCSILDYGSGTGDFWDYVKSRIGKATFASVDMNPKFVQRGREKGWGTMLGNVLDDEFFESLPTYHYVVASGIFCYDYPGARENNQEIVRRLYAKCSRALIFNVLRSSRTGNLIYASGWEQFCQDGPFQIIADYLPNDVTIVLRRQLR